MPRGRRWSEWAKEGRSQTIAPWARVPRQAGEWRGWRSLTDPGGRHCPPSRGCGRARAVARRAASSGPARAACILPGPAGCGGPSWAAPPQQGGEPPAGHRGSSGAQGSRREMLGARWGVAGCPCRTWGSLWGGAPSVGRGGSSGVGRGPLTRARSRVGQAPEFCERAGVPERVAVGKPRQGPGVRGAPGAIPRSRGERGISGYAGHPGRARVPGVRSAPGGAQWDKCGRGRDGAGVGSEVPGCPRARLRGAAGGRAAAARAPPCCSAAGREGERRAGERRGAGPGGGLGPPGGGGEDPARGAGGRGRGGPGRAAGSRSELGARARRGGVCRAWQALAGSALALSLVPSHARGGRQSPQQPLPNFPNFPAQLFPLLPCLSLPPPPSPFPSPAPRWVVAPERHRQRASGLMLSLLNGPHAKRWKSNGQSMTNLRTWASVTEHIRESCKE